jgi:hypothetical protein
LVFYKFRKSEKTKNYFKKIAENSKILGKARKFPKTSSGPKKEKKTKEFKGRFGPTLAT